jgi:hypothetical protein
LVESSGEAGRILAAHNSNLRHDVRHRLASAEPDARTHAEARP